MQNIEEERTRLRNKKEAEKILSEASIDVSDQGRKLQLILSLK